MRRLAQAALQAHRRLSASGTSCVLEQRTALLRAHTTAAPLLHVSPAAQPEERETELLLAELLRGGGASALSPDQAQALTSVLRHFLLSNWCVRQAAPAARRSPVSVV